MKSCSPARRATWALDATSNPRPSMNFLFTEESEQQKKIFSIKKKRIFEKQSPQIATENFSWLHYNNKFCKKGVTSNINFWSGPSSRYIILGHIMKTTNILKIGVAGDNYLVLIARFLSWAFFISIYICIQVEI